MSDLVSCFRERSKFSDVIIVNGGLGPTSDDLSAQAAAQAADLPLVEFPEWVAVLEQKFKRMAREMPASNLKQAMLPQSAEILDNPVGTACGFVLKLNRALLYFTPGVPHEMKRMMKSQVMPHIRKTLHLENTSTLKRLHCFGVSEARLGALLDAIHLPEGVKLGYRAHLPTIEIKIMASGPNAKTLESLKEAAAASVRSLIGDNLCFEDDHSLATHIQSLMIKRGFTLSTAESCTGGMTMSQLVDVAGSSAYIERGFITYTNEAKMEMLGVPRELIDSHGAVSLEVARAMAQGAREKSGSSHALFVSGVAGPGGGTEEKPVGTVAFSLATPTGSWSQVIRAPQWGRAAIRKISSAVMLDMLRRHLEDRPVFGEYDYAGNIQTAEDLPS